MAVYNSHNTKQWEELLNAINGGDTSSIATALGLIKTSIDSINTSLGSLSVGVEQDTTQWANLINAITNQSLNVDLSNITSTVVSNLSNVSGNTITDALNSLNSTLNNLYTLRASSTRSGKGLTVKYFTFGKFTVLQCISSLNVDVSYDEILVSGLPASIYGEDMFITCTDGIGLYLKSNGELRTIYRINQGTRITFSYMYLTA